MNNYMVLMMVSVFCAINFQDCYASDSHKILRKILQPKKSVGMPSDISQKERDMLSRRIQKLDDFNESDNEGEVKSDSNKVQSQNFIVPINVVTVSDENIRNPERVDVPQAAQLNNNLIEQCIDLLHKIMNDADVE